MLMNIPLYQLLYNINIGSPTKKDAMETFSILKPMKMQDFKKKNYEVY